MDFEAISFFVKVVDARSLSDAARLHGVAKSTISYKIRRLEDVLGVALFVREGREMLLTDAGAEFLTHARRILAACSSAEDAASSFHRTVAGTLTIGSTGEFGTSFTSELLCAFRKSYPQIRLDVIILSPAYLFSPERQMAFDGIFSMGEPFQLDYIARRLTRTRFGLCASADYLARNGTPAGPADLRGHRGILHRQPTGVEPWRLRRGEESVEIMPDAECVSNDYWMAKYFAVAGEGIALLPEFFVEMECATGHLVPVLPDWHTEEVPVNLLYPRRRYVSQKFAVFLDFCLQYYGSEKSHCRPKYCAVVDHGPTGELGAGG